MPGYHHLIHVHGMQMGMNLPLEKLPTLIGQGPAPPENENFLTSPSWGNPPPIKVKIFWPPPNFSNSLDLRFLSISINFYVPM